MPSLKPPCMHSTDSPCVCLHLLCLCSNCELALYFVALPISRVKLLLNVISRRCGSRPLHTYTVSCQSITPCCIDLITLSHKMSNTQQKTDIIQLQWTKGECVNIWCSWSWTLGSEHTTGERGFNVHSALLSSLPFFPLKNQDKVFLQQRLWGVFSISAGLLGSDAHDWALCSSLCRAQWTRWFMFLICKFIIVSKCH